jgi:predicted GH43/DUF377 family glycosyl hydrolase
VDWIRDGEISLPRTPDAPDSLRAWRPWVLEEADGALRMWYTGSDGTTSRILAATRARGGAWERRGIAVDAGFAGDTDSYGAESPSVVRTPGGYLMVYGGFDGEVSRLHMATSSDAVHWDAHDTIMQRGPEDAGGANHPSLLITGERWWLFYTGYPEANRGRSVLVAAVSQSGASWDRVGTILEPEMGEAAVSHPCTLEISRTFYMFYATDARGPIRTEMASSSDGLSWDRRGVVLEPGAAGPDGLGVHTPCALKLRDGTLVMWYAGLSVGDGELSYRICSARFPGPWST